MLFLQVIQTFLKINETQLSGNSITPYAKQLISGNARGTAEHTEELAGY